MTGYVYIKSEPQLWTAGIYQPGGRFEPESDHGSPELAAARVIELNGGAPAGPVSADTWASGSMPDMPGAPAVADPPPVADYLHDLLAVAEGCEGMLEDASTAAGLMAAALERIAVALEQQVKLTERSTVALERMQDHAQFGPGW